MVSAVETAKRALVVLLRTIAAAYGLAFSLTRGSGDAEVRSAKCCQVPSSGFGSSKRHVGRLSRRAVRHRGDDGDEMTDERADLWR